MAGPDLTAQSAGDPPGPGDSKSHLGAPYPEKVLPCTSAPPALGRRKLGPEGTVRTQVGREEWQRREQPRDPAGGGALGAHRVIPKPFPSNPTWVTSSSLPRALQTLVAALYPKSEAQFLRGTGPPRDQTSPAQPRGPPRDPPFLLPRDGSPGTDKTPKKGPRVASLDGHQALQKMP